jgi:hypothetical protein
LLKWHPILFFTVCRRLSILGARLARERAERLALTFRQPYRLDAHPLAASAAEMGEAAWGFSLDISQTALGGLPDRKLTGSIGSRLEQITNKVAAACGSLVASLREVLNDRFWEESP